MDFSKFDGNKFNDDMDRATHSSREVRGEVSGQQAAILAQETLDKLELMRKELARCYSAVPGGTTIEHEIGEVLTQVRKSIKRVRTAVGELSQQKLPLDD